jgi:hypothetical protein
MRTTLQDTANTTTQTAIPASHLDLLERPVIPHVATVLGDGTPRITPTRFYFDGAHILFTTTPSHIVCKTLPKAAHASISLQDPDDPFRSLEVRAVVEAIEPDPEARLLAIVGRKYGIDFPPPTTLPSDRVVLRLRPLSAVPSVE